jgi:pectate lyase
VFPEFEMRLLLKLAELVGVGLYINKVKNVVVRNIISQKVIADNGDAIGIQASSNVWVDHWYSSKPNIFQDESANNHSDLSSDMNNGKDYYDGLIDITHASEVRRATHSPRLSYLVD